MSHAVAVIDDEPPARAKLLRFLADFPDFGPAVEAGSVEEALDVLARTTPAVAFLDIRLGSRSGFEVLDAIRGSLSPLIVFTTAYSEHAVRAFELHALDYLLKPFDRDRFHSCIERLRAALARPEHADVEGRIRRLLAALPERPAAPRQVLVRTAERALFVPVDTIERVSAAGNYVEVQAAGRTYLVRDTLSAFIASLDPREFLRVHRSHVVRVGHIAELRPMFHGDYELVLRDGRTVALSRRYKALLPAEFRDRL